MKRLIDVCLSFLGLVVLSPFFILIAILVFLVDRQPPLFFQTRIGEWGVPFRIVKFRTMRGAPVVDPALVPPHVVRSMDKHRITVIGRLMRKYGIDELPQLWNILVGEMSFVGPRPLSGYLVTRGDYMPIVCGARPGLTGLAQIQGRKMKETSWRRFNRLYALRQCLSLDLYIIVRTLHTITVRRYF
jgi:lipopolysaccharide/colanic/teichoic acid biosynthesis glycosyltransferase